MNLDQSALGLWQPVPGRTRCEPSPLQLAFVLAPTNEHWPPGGPGPNADGRKPRSEERQRNRPRASRAGPSGAASAALREAVAD